MKKIFVLILILFLSGCAYSKDLRAIRQSIDDLKNTYAIYESPKSEVLERQTQAQERQTQAQERQAQIQEYNLKK